MRSFKRWLDRSPTAQAILVFLVGVGVTALFRPNEHPVWWVVQGLFYSGIVVTVLAVQRRKVGRAVGADARAIADLNRRLRHREVPTDPEDRATMRRLVALQLGQIERGRRRLPYWMASMGLLAVGMIALGAATGSLVLPLVFAVGLFGFCYWILWMRRRSVDRHRFMQAALEGQSEHVPRAGERMP